MKIYNMVGTIEFKQKFGGVETTTAMVCKSRYRVISRLRSSVPRMAKAAVRMAWKVKTAARRKPGSISE